MIPVLDLARQTQALRAELDTAIDAVLRSGHFILGTNVEAFEREFAQYCGARHAVGVASGTDALELALRALDIGAGDEVITTPFTFVATAEAISCVGATPVFADVEPESYNLDPKAVERVISPKTKAMIVVHLYGRPARLDAFERIARERGIHLIEDCAQSAGSRYRQRHVGTFGIAGCFSFFPSKNLGAFGDGGMVTTDDERVAGRVRRLRVHGSAKKYCHEEIGCNSRLDELQAAILRVKLRHLAEWVEARRAVARRYTDGLQELARAGVLALPVESSECYSSYHLYTVASSAREQLQESLRQRDIATAVHYPVPLHRQPAYAFLGYHAGRCPNAERASTEVLSLPCFPELAPQEIDLVLGAVRQAMTASRVSS